MSNPPLLIDWIFYVSFKLSFIFDFLFLLRLLDNFNRFTIGVDFFVSKAECLFRLCVSNHTCPKAWTLQQFWKQNSILVLSVPGTQSVLYIQIEYFPKHAVIFSSLLCIKSSNFLDFSDFYLLIFLMYS